MQVGVVLCGNSMSTGQLCLCMVETPPNSNIRSVLVLYAVHLPSTLLNAN